MKIVVCVKRVPDTATKVKIAGDGKSIDPADVEYIVSPYDELAVEHAVQLKEKLGDVEIVVVSMGPAETEKTLRHCLAMGGDRGILVEDAESGRDPFVVAQALADVVRQENPDLLLFGVKAVDDDYGQVGAITASLLEMTSLLGIGELEIADGKAKVRTEIDGGYQYAEAALPCAATISKGSIEARICSLINIRKARKKEINTVAAPAFSEPTVAVEKLELPPARTGGRIVGEGPDAVPELFRLLREEAKVL